MKIVVTGINGFVGSHLARFLVASGHEVTGLVRSKSRLHLLAGLDIRLVRGDVCEPEGLPAVLRGADVVYHTAGLTKGSSLATFMNVNAQGAENVAAACADCPTPPTLVHISSLAAAGPSPPDRPRQEADPAVPVSYYGKSKLAGEAAVRKFAARVPTTIVRPPIVIGFGDDNLMGFVRMVFRHGMHLVPGTMASPYSVIHASDLALGLLQAARLAARLPAECDDNQTGIYYMAGDEHPGYDELGRLIGQAVGRESVRIVYTPRWLAWSIAAGTEGVSRLRGKASLINIDKLRDATAGGWVCSPSRAKADLGFRVAAPLVARLREVAQQMIAAGAI
ncbi:MAG TPA: NAD-dependent epimerase/dehydratase family protein [Pirellulales bacterium]|jgi:nucleoside-diphosphate-sugar epimerase|nr:NAD-dependent epimerase/dehydratase family protein [Pirellulales bacterium]